MKTRKDGIARRCDVLLQTDAERAIGMAIRKVEAMGAHPDLTNIVTSLTAIKDQVGDFVEEKLPSFMSPSLLSEIEQIKKAMSAT